MAVIYKHLKPCGEVFYIGIYYKSMSEVCRIFGYSRKGIIRKLDNIEKNDTNLIRV